MNKVEITDKEINPETGNININLEIDLIHGTNKILNSYTGEAIDNSAFIYGYVGENKWRITSEIRTESDDHSFCFQTKFDRYKHIVAIDTNIARYKSKVFDQEVFIGIGIGVALIQQEEITELQPLGIPFITSICPETPENENWIQLIELMRKTCHCEDSRKIGIVVDSDYGNIPDYNKRSKPILANYFLPENFELIFASDKVTDNVFNKMIRFSHQLTHASIPDLVIDLVKSEEDILRTFNEKYGTQHRL